MASFGLESSYLTLAGWLSFIQFSVCPSGGTYLSNTKEIRGGLNICKNIKNCIQLPLILWEFMPYLSGSISRHQSLVYARKWHFLSLLLVLSHEAYIAMKPILVGPEKGQLGRFTLHTVIEGMQFWFMISWFISIFIQTLCHRTPINRSREKKFAFYQSWRFTGAHSHINL